MAIKSGLDTVIEELRTQMDSPHCCSAWEQLPVDLQEKIEAEANVTRMQLVTLIDSLDDLHQMLEGINNDR